MKMPLKIAVGCIVILLLVAAGSPLYAHKVNVYAYRQGNAVSVESYFPDGKKIIGGRVEVFDQSGSRLVEGVTDESGRFDFTAPSADALTVVVTASLGHKVSYTLPADKVSGTAHQPVGAPRNETPPPKERFPANAVTSGIGYIVGIMGIIFFILTKRERAR